MTLSKFVLLSSVTFTCLFAGCSVAQPVIPQDNRPATDAPKLGGILKTAGDDLTDFDLVYQGKTIENARDHGLVFDTLLRFKRGPEVEYISQILQPSLAEKWEVSADAKTFTYQLRRGVKFTNTPPVNGRDFTAADVKWSMEYYSRTGAFSDKKYPPSQMQPLFEGLDGIDTPDNHTVRVRFKEPFAPFLNYGASQWMPMVAKETFKAEENPPALGTLVGTGPYIYDEANSQKGNRFVFTKNPSYWGTRPYLDSIQRLVIPDESTRVAAFAVKQIDTIAPSTYKMATQVKQANPQAVLAESLDPYAWTMFTSQKRGGALADIRVRRAISLAMDRDEFNQVVSGGKGAWALTGSWPGLFTDAETHAMLKYDPEQAKKLLAEAGYGNGLKLELLLVTADHVPDELFQAQMKRVGIDLQISNLAREITRSKLYVGDYDLTRIGPSGGDADFDARLFSFYSTASQNWALLQDPDLDKLILDQRREGNPQKRREIQRATVKRLTDMVWSPAYAFPVKTMLWHPYVKNYSPHFTVGEDDAFVWLDK